MKRANSAKSQARISAWRVLKNVLPYLWPRNRPGMKARVVFSLITLLIAELITLGIPFIYKSAVDSLATDNADNTGYLVALGAVTLTVAYGVARILAVAFDELRSVIFARVGHRALRELALETFRHIHKLSLSFHLSRKTGALSRIIERGVKSLEWLLRFVLFSIGPLIIQLVLVCIVMLTLLGPWYVVTVAVTILGYVWFTFSVTEWRVQIRKEMNKQDTAANQKAIDSLLNFETVKYFSAEEREAWRYDSSMRKYEAASLKTTYSLAFLNFGQALIITIGTVTVMILAAIGVQKGVMTIGDFVLVNTYMIQISMPLNFLGTVYREIRQALIDMGEMFDLLEVPYEVTDSPDARDLVIGGGRIEFRNVHFGYDKARPILKGINLTIEPGQTVAIVGPSGSGKSTIARLLFRFYDVTDGSLCIDGQDVRDVTLKSLHACIGMVPQDTVLFNDTIYYNIAYGRDGATRDVVESVTRAAHLDTFIDSLPDGYETMVGERGLKLSGGEKQRVGISRTLLKNPQILLLDEATSSLDTETEQEIQESFRIAGEGRSVIAIAHRLSTIVEADLIVVLENGKIVEQGTLDELLALEGRYAQMWHLQLAEDLPAG